MAVVCVPLKRKGITHIMKIDYEDWKELSKFKWHLSCGYARRSPLASLGEKRGTGYFLHRIICPTELTVDHINMDKLDNRRCNLRACSLSNNMANTKRNNRSTSGYKGVSKRKGRKTWQASIIKDYKDYYLGEFKSPEEAFEAYKAKARELYGEFARW